VFRPAREGRGVERAGRSPCVPANVGVTPSRMHCWHYDAIENVMTGFAGAPSPSSPLMGAGLSRVGPREQRRSSREALEGEACGPRNPV